MRTLYFDCGMGAAGDMLCASLLDLMPDAQEVIAALRALALPGVELSLEKAAKCGIRGTRLRVAVGGREEHSEDVPGWGASPARGEACAGGHADSCAQAHTQGEQAHGHAHERGHSHTDAHGHAHGNEHSHADAHGHSYGHDHGHSHGHAHEHSHADAHGHAHEDGHSHAHGDAVRGLREIEALIAGLPLTERSRAQAIGVYKLIAEAESRVHGVPVEQIHFHEVGSLDAVADILCFCLLMERLAPERVLASPIHVGAGHVRCAHGILPVPAPATAELLKGLPIYGGAVEGELCTPTGAALLRYFADDIGPLPPLRVAAIGYGLGQKDYARANCVRALLGEAAGAGASGPRAAAAEEEREEEIWELHCNIDDMTAEELAFAAEGLLAAGALDVFTLPAGMKKARAGTLLCLLCRAEDKEALARLVFRLTTTLGLREWPCRRKYLARRVEAASPAPGAPRKKIAEGFGLRREKWEYEDLAALARARGLSLREAARECGQGEK